MYCNICQKRVLAHSYHLICVSCKGVVHLNCLPKITRDDAIYTQRHLNQFYCTLCLNGMLPFNNLDDEAFCEAISEIQLKQTPVSFQILQNQELIFSPFDFNEKSDTPLHDIDPDIQFYSDKYSLHSCDYYLEEMFNDKIFQNKVKDNNFSMLHANIRSAQKNLTSLERYINNLDHNFTVIGISESWFKEHNVDRYGIEGYNGVHTFRPIRSGGGVSIFVQTLSSILCEQTSAI